MIAYPFRFVNSAYQINLQFYGWYDILSVKGVSGMATWVTHLMIADKILREICRLDRRGFCVGNIAPDCNVENANFTTFTPARKVTHFMRGQKKTEADGDRFCKEHIINCRDMIQTQEQYSFLLGYYAHLITDAAYAKMTCDSARIKALWKRIRADRNLRVKAEGLSETWDGAKKVFSKSDRLREIYTMEAEYLSLHPESGYLTEILPLKEFPDYLDYLPKGAIVRKIGVMGYMPKKDEGVNPIVISQEEYAVFVANTACLVIDKLGEKGLV